MARETTQRFLMLRSSFSLAWSSLGQLWKTRQPFSLKLLHSANQIEVLDKLLLSSVPAALRGEKQPITHKQVATTAIFALAWNESHRGSRWGWKGGGGGGAGGCWGGLDTNKSICWSSPPYPLCWLHPLALQNRGDPWNNVVSSGARIPKINYRY